jgi:hypothetical protein
VIDHLVDILSQYLLPSMAPFNNATLGASLSAMAAQHKGFEAQHNGFEHAI